MTIDPLASVLPLMIAHRAGNDPERARLAHAAGADFIEADIWLYRGRLEVRHAKTMRILPLLWDRWSIEQGWRPRFLLEDLLAMMPAQAGLMLDLKGRDTGLPAAILHALTAHPCAGRIAVCSQNWRLVDAFDGLPGITIVHSAGKARHLRRLLAHLAAHRGDVPPAISIQQRLLDADTVRDLKRISAHLMTWPVNDIARARELLAWGVDGIISDDIDVIRAIVAERS